MVQKYKKTKLRKNALDFLFWVKGNAGRINTVSFPRNRWPIVKNMPLVSATVRANNFDTNHA